ncbi:MAG: tRNA (adenosine(37)-N6)-threonylcarbamoyltransferase complex dimerization subunit type 1 TsaB [Leptospiraceae bacterium]|nr:tRNA (adenosine(37)-N6)-threonylcarbamoyltransferase complex dimerization subunit type 1 TsaB [Leptospiraceae bacterium]
MKETEVKEARWSAPEGEILAFDTCSSALCVCLGSQEDFLSVVQPGRNRSSMDLVPVIQRLLAERSIQKPDCIAVTVGPGSFTGTRIGVSTARNLGMLWDIPVIPYFSLQLYADTLLRDMEMRKQTPFPFLVSVDGKQNRFYSLLVDCAGVVSDTTEEMLLDLSPEEIVESTEGMEIYCDERETLKERLPENRSVMDLPQPAPESFFRLLQRSSSRPQSYDRIVPVYVRKDPATARYPGGFGHKPRASDKPENSRP